jgi:hypothetical protein
MHILLKANIAESAYMCPFEVKFGRKVVGKDTVRRHPWLLNRRRRSQELNRVLRSIASANRGNSASGDLERVTDPKTAEFLGTSSGSIHLQDAATGVQAHVNSGSSLLRMPQ